MSSLQHSSDLAPKTHQLCAVDARRIMTVGRSPYPTSYWSTPPIPMTCRMSCETTSDTGSHIPKQFGVQLPAASRLYPEPN
jgi:hypothetical protein